MKSCMLALLAALTFFVSGAPAQSPATMPSSAPARPDLLELVLRKRCQQLGQLLLAPQEPSARARAPKIRAGRPPIALPQPEAQPQMAPPVPMPAADDAPTTQAAGEAGGAAADPEPSPQAQALAALLDLQDAVLSPLAEQLDSEDLEARTRAADTLRQMSQAAHRTQLGSLLAGEERAKLASLAAKAPSLANLALSPDEHQQEQALDRLMGDTSLRGLIEPLLAIYLRTGHQSLRRAAFGAIGQLKCGSQPIVDALLRLANSGQWDERQEVWSLLRDVGGMRGMAAIARMIPGRELNEESCIMACDLLSDCGHRELMPLLVSLLDKPSRSSGTWETNNVKLYHDRNDYLLAAAVRLSGQNLDTYKIVAGGQDGPWPGMVGFAGKDDRRAAVAKFKKWWADNKDKPPYKGLPQPEPVKDNVDENHLDLLNVILDPQRRPATDPVLDVAALREQLQRRAAQSAELLDSYDARLRRQGQQNLLRLHATVLDSLAQCNSELAHEAVQQAVLRLAAVAACLDKAAYLPREQRTQLLELPRHYPAAFTGFFCLSTYSQLQTMEMIHSDSTDSMGYFEPLVAMAVGSEDNQVRRQALAVVCTGRYHGAELARQVEKAFDEVCSQSFRREEYQSQEELQTCLKALIACGSPRAGALLLEAFWKCGESLGPRTQVVLKGLIDSKQVGAAPALMTKLSQTRTTGRWKSGSAIGGTAPSDLSLYALLRLTAQEPGDYDMLLAGSGGYELPQRIGFKDSQARQRAIQKFQAWWEENKERPPYKDAKALPVPKAGPTAVAPEHFPPGDPSGMIEE